MYRRNMGLRDIEATLPPGFRFYPSDEELICHYLFKKVANQKSYDGTMVEVDLHSHEPWELPDVAKLSDNEWYFFSFRDRKYATGLRANRATKSGYWKATGKDRTVYKPRTRSIVGMRKTLVFYSGRAPNGIKTGWVMHEFRLENPHKPPKEDWVLCRVFHKHKGESVRFSLDREREENKAAICLSPPPLIEQPMEDDACYGHLMGSSIVPHQDQGSTTLLNLALLQYNFHDFTPDVGTTAMIGGDHHGDEYGFLFDVGLEVDDDHGIGGCGGIQLLEDDGMHSI